MLQRRNRLTDAVTSGEKGGLGGCDWEAQTTMHKINKLQGYIAQQGIGPTFYSCEWGLAFKNYKSLCDEHLKLMWYCVSTTSQ